LSCAMSKQPFETGDRLTADKLGNVFIKENILNAVLKKKVTETI